MGLCKVGKISNVWLRTKTEGMALIFTKIPLPGQHRNRSKFVFSNQFTEVANCSNFPSDSKKTSHEIRSQKKVKDNNPNAQSVGISFKPLYALKTDKNPSKNIMAKPQKKNPQSIQNHEERKNRIGHQGKRNESPRNPSSEDSEFRNNEDVLHSSTRATVEPSLRGEDIILALQKASVLKANEEGRRKVKRKNANRVNSTRKGSSKTMPRVVGNARPITLKPEWGARIESLEHRLKELKERAELS